MAQVASLSSAMDVDRLSSYMLNIHQLQGRYQQDLDMSDTDTMGSPMSDEESAMCMDDCALDEQADSSSSTLVDSEMEAGDSKVGTSIWQLPPELRHLIYQELLLSDSAFRLGHHGPYSHESRKQLYPQILRTCRNVFLEASEVLYGDNTFYLGPVGHKPTYSASFVTSIGSHNANKIRTVVAHSTHYSSLTERWLRSWINSFGLDVKRLKILAISFSPLPSHHSHSASSSTTTLSSQLYHHPPPPAYAQPSTFTPFLGPPGGHFSVLTTVVLPGSGPPPPPASAVVGSSPVMSPTSEQDEVEKAQLDWALMESRMASWLTRAEKKEVTSWVQTKNTDLRADRWLLFVSSSYRAMRSMRG